MVDFATVRKYVPILLHRAGPAICAVAREYLAQRFNRITSNYLFSNRGSWPLTGFGGRRGKIKGVTKTGLYYTARLLCLDGSIFQVVQMSRRQDGHQIPLMNLGPGRDGLPSKN